MSQERETVRINVNVAHAEDALSRIISSATWDHSLNESVNTIQLVLKVCEHKMLRLQELEKEIGKLRMAASVKSLSDNTNLAEHCASLEVELAEAKRQIVALTNSDYDSVDSAELAAG